MTFGCSSWTCKMLTAVPHKKHWGIFHFTGTWTANGRVTSSFCRRICCWCLRICERQHFSFSLWAAHERDIDCVPPSYVPSISACKCVSFRKMRKQSSRLLKAEVRRCVTSPERMLSVLDRLCDRITWIQPCPFDMWTEAPTIATSCTNSQRSHLMRQLSVNNHLF